MSRYFRRDSKKKRDEVRRVIQDLSKKGMSSSKILFAEIMKVKEATKREHAWGRYFVILGNSPPTAQIMNRFVREINIFNKDRDFNTSIIGADYRQADVYGRERNLSVLELSSEGKQAEKAAQRARERAEGNLEQEKLLLADSKDKTLKRRHLKKLKEIEQEAQRL